MKKSTMLYVFVLLAVLLSITPAYAAAPPYFLNGTINRSDQMAGSAGLTGVTLTLNSTNTTTTNATGFFSLANVKNGSYTVAVTVPNDGYNAPVDFTGTIDGDHNTTLKRNVTLVTPAISAVTESAIGRTGGTVAWTSSISTVGNRIIYTRDSALTNNLVTSSWSNSTASPSFTLSGLDIFNTYYYQVETYNDNNQTYSATTTGDFKTLAGNPEEDPESYELVSVPGVGQQSAKSIVARTQGQVTKSKTNKVIAFGVIIVVLYFVLYGKKKK